MSITAATLKREVLDPVLDAQALNEAQGLGYFDPSPERDSLVEIFNAPDMPAHHAAAGLAIISGPRGVQANQAERERQRRIAGFADETVAHLRGAELNGGGPAGVPAKQIARTLRSPLDAWSEQTATAREVAAALRVFVGSPPAQLLAPAVQHNLGQRRFRRLEQIVQSFYEREPGAASSGPAANRGTTSDALAES